MAWDRIAWARLFVVMVMTILSGDRVSGGWLWGLGLGW